MKKPITIVVVVCVLIVAVGLFVLFEKPQYLAHTPFNDSANIVREKTLDTTKSVKNFLSETISNHPNMQKTIDNVQNQVSETVESTLTIQESIQEKVVETVKPIIPSESKKPHEELIQHALEKINEDRAKNNLRPVLLSSNMAAQSHANNVFDQKIISHWMSNGEKPYMTYTKSGGTGSVSQNVATSTCVGFGCGMNPIKDTESSEYSMMYDDASSDWGHHDNILQPYHTHVSIGVSYDDNFFVLVQNFEDNYLISENPISVTGSHVQINSNLKSGSILNIGVFYDPPPSSDLYLNHRDDGSYMIGDSIAVVVPPAPLNSYYTQPSEHKLIEAKRWSINDNSVVMDFDISSLLTKPGVYTVGVWVNEGGRDFLVTNYSIFHNLGFSKK